MSLPMDRSVELFTLPNEIISQIFSLPILRRRDLAALRLSSKHINASASRDFGKRYFEFVHFTIFKQSLVALRDICQHPLLGPWVRHIRSFAQKPVDIKATLLGSIEYTDRVLQSVRFQSLRRVMLMRIQTILSWCAHWTFQCLCWFITLFALEAHCSTPGILESSSALDPQ